jgi:hypothetical protein
LLLLLLLLLWQILLLLLHACPLSLLLLDPFQSSQHAALSIVETIRANVAAQSFG